MHNNQKSIARRGRPLILVISTLLAISVASSPVSVPAFSEWWYENKVNSIDYKKLYGHWQVLDLPEEFKLNTIHGAALPTGKILLVAGSGNNRQDFNAFHNEGKIQVLKTVVLDPETMDIKTVETPSDLFCSGHALLQGGNLLIAGGTSGYELLENEVKNQPVQ